MLAWVRWASPASSSSVVKRRTRLIAGLSESVSIEGRFSSGFQDPPKLGTRTLVLYDMVNHAEANYEIVLNCISFRRASTGMFPYLNIHVVSQKLLAKS
jgi:hypothetical protein